MASTKPSLLWSVNSGKCLALTVNSDNNEKSVTCKELRIHGNTNDNTRESSIVEFKEAYDLAPNAICFRIVFTLDKKEYALHVDNNTVTALEATEEATYFVTDSAKFVSHPAFVTLEVGSSGTYITVDKEGRLSVLAFDSTAKSPDITFVKID